MTTVWSPSTWKPTTTRPHLERQRKVSPAALSGKRRVRGAPGGLWILSFGGIALYDPAQVAAWMAFVAEADGGATAFEVRLAARLTQPWPVVDGAQVYSPGGIAVTLDGAHALNATSLTVNKTSGEALGPGQHFSVTGSRWGKRLHRIITASALGGGDWALTIRPGLREDLASGTSLDFETPGVLATVANPESIEPELDHGRFAGSMTVVFEEDFNR